MTTVTLAEIIRVASEAYPEGLVDLYFKDPTHKHGDTLARFIAIELKETYEAEATNDTKWVIAAHAIDNAIRELGSVRTALTSHIGEL